jgi:hypothetical protein
LFYRGWIVDNTATTEANRFLVRRNHVYYISVTDISGPGIADPNYIIDRIACWWLEPIEEAETYSTAQIKTMNWHVIHQQMQN